jgi:hypothetical protein
MPCWGGAPGRWKEMTCGPRVSVRRGRGGGTDLVREACWTWAASWPGPVSLPAAFSYFLFFLFSFFCFIFSFISFAIFIQIKSNHFQKFCKIHIKVLNQ